MYRHFVCKPISGDMDFLVHQACYLQKLFLRIFYHEYLKFELYEIIKSIYNRQLIIRFLKVEFDQYHWHSIFFYWNIFLNPILLVYLLRLE